MLTRCRQRAAVKRPSPALESTWPAGSAVHPDIVADLSSTFMALRTTGSAALTRFSAFDPSGSMSWRTTVVRTETPAATSARPRLFREGGPSPRPRRDGCRSNRADGWIARCRGCDSERRRQSQSQRRRGGGDVLRPSNGGNRASAILLHTRHDRASIPPGRTSGSLRRRRCQPRRRCGEDRCAGVADSW